MKVAWERRGGGEPLLLIHGLGYARWGWEPVVEPLARRFELLLFDNRGIGESDAPAGPYTVAQLAADAVQVLDEAGVDRAHVLGTSLGGMVAQELVHAHPERVDRLVLVSTTPGGPHAHPMPERTAALLAGGASLREFVANALEPEPRDEQVERILAHRLRVPQAPEAWAAQAAAGAAFAGYDRLGEIDAPTLVLHGDGDTVVDVRNAELLGELLPNAAVRVFPGTGHLLFWQQPEAFVAAVEEFLL